MNVSFPMIKDRVISYNFLLLILEICFSGSLIFGILDLIRGETFYVLFVYALLALLLTRFFATKTKSKGWKGVFLFLSGFLSVFSFSANIIISVGSFGLIFSSLPYYFSITDLFFRYLSIGVALQEITFNLQTFFVNLMFWVDQMFSASPVQLEQPVRFFSGIVVFFVIGWFGWYLHITKRPLLAILPGLLILGLGVDVFRGANYYISLLLSLGLLVVVLFTHANRELEWENEGVGYSQEIRLEISWLALFLAMIIFVIGILIPSVSVKEIIEKYEESQQTREIFEDEIGQPSSSNNRSDDLIPEFSGVLPNSHLVAGPPELRKTKLFQVHVIDENKDNKNSRFYWRVQTFEKYMGNGWVMGKLKPENFSAGEIISDQLLLNNETTTLEFTIQSDLVENKLIYSNTLIQVNQPTQILFREYDEDSKDFAFGLVEAQNYTVDIVDSRENPSSFLEENEVLGISAYLEVPDSVPFRVIQLAEQIVTGAPDAYSKARRIENYLRQFEYTLDLGLPPADRDIVDYFLFDLQMGYCDYYASSMVIMARAVGLPARLVVGYVEGEYDSSSNSYQVTGEEGHTWVEVYIPEFGWVEFEPTAGRPAINRTSVFEDDNQIPSIADTTKPAFDLPDYFEIPYFKIVLIMLVLVISFSAGSLMRYYSKSEAILLVNTKENLYKLGEICGLSQPEFLTLLEIKNGIQKRFSQNLNSSIGRILKDKIFILVNSSANLLMDVAYCGKPIKSLKKRGLIRKIVYSKWVTRLLQILTKFPWLRI